jgi:hypothetical protein
MGGVVSDVLGGVGDVVKGGVNIAGDMLEPALKVGKWSMENPLEAAALGAGAYYAAPALFGSGGAAAGGGLGLTSGGAAGGGLLEGLGTATGADLAAAYDMGAVGAAGAGGFTPAAAGGLFSGLGSTLGGLSTGQMLGLGAGALALSGAAGNKPTSSTTSTAIDPEMKAAYLRNLEEARGVASGLGQRQFAAFPEYSTNMVQKYMNPYEDTVVQNAIGDIERQRQTQMANEGAQATASKAFGGSRQAVQRALVDEAALRQSGALGAQLRQQGFTQAQNLALQQEQLRQAYEQQKLDAARNLGLEQLNIRQGALGLQPANLGGTSTSPIYRNTSASALGGALSGGMLGNLIGGKANPEYAGYGAGLGGLLGLL